MTPIMPFSSSVSKLSPKPLLAWWAALKMRYRLTILLVLILAVLGLGTQLSARSGNNPGIDGDYSVVFKGCFQGAGEARVVGKGKKIVYLRGDLTDTTDGKVGQFKVMNLDFNVDGRFSGAGTFNKTAGKKYDVNLVGRLEPADGVVIKKARIICTFTVKDVGAGRAIGSHNP
jgi:hypothetical protein